MLFAVTAEPDGNKNGYKIDGAASRLKKQKA